MDFHQEDHSKDLLILLNTIQTHNHGFNFIRFSFLYVLLAIGIGLQIINIISLGIYNILHVSGFNEDVFSVSFED